MIRIKIEMLVLMKMMMIMIKEYCLYSAIWSQCSDCIAVAIVNKIVNLFAFPSFKLHHSSFFKLLVLLVTIGLREMRNHLPLPVSWG